MNNLKRTLVKTYGILFSVLGESGIKHICSLAPRKSNKLNVLFKQYRRLLSIFVTPLRALHMFQCVFNTKSSSFLPSLEWKERKPPVKHCSVHIYQWLIGIIVKGKKMIFVPHWGAVVSTDVSQPKDSGVRSPLGTGAFLSGFYAFFLWHNWAQTDSMWKECVFGASLTCLWLVVRVERTCKAVHLYKEEVHRRGFNNNHLAPLCDSVTSSHLNQFVKSTGCFKIRRSHRFFMR